MITGQSAEELIPRTMRGSCSKADRRAFKSSVLFNLRKETLAATRAAIFGAVTLASAHAPSAVPSKWIQSYDLSLEAPGYRISANDNAPQKIGQELLDPATFRRVANACGLSD